MWIACAPSSSRRASAASRGGRSARGTSPRPARARGTPAATCIGRRQVARLAAALAALRPLRRCGLGARVRGAASRGDGPLAGRSARARLVGGRDLGAGRVPHESVLAAARRLREARKHPRCLLLPWASRHAGHARVRRVLRDHAAPARRHRPRPGDERGDGGARARDGARPREGAPDPDRRSTSRRSRSAPRPTSRRPGAPSTSRRRRSSSARSRRTAWAGAKGSSRS